MNYQLRNKFAGLYNAELETRVMLTASSAEAPSDDSVGTSNNGSKNSKSSEAEPTQASEQKQDSPKSDAGKSESKASQPEEQSKQVSSKKSLRDKTSTDQDRAQKESRPSQTEQASETAAEVATAGATGEPATGATDAAPVDSASEQTEQSSAANTGAEPTQASEQKQDSPKSDAGKSESKASQPEEQSKQVSSKKSLRDKTSTDQDRAQKESRPSQTEQASETAAEVATAGATGEPATGATDAAPVDPASEQTEQSSAANTGNEAEPAEVAPQLSQKDVDQALVNSAQQYSNRIGTEAGQQQIGHALLGSKGFENLNQQGKAVLGTLNQEIANRNIAATAGLATGANAEGPTNDLPRLEQGVNAATVKTENGSQVLYNRSLDRSQLGDASNEEYGEAIKNRAENLGLNVPEGDVGSRLALAVKQNGKVNESTNPELFAKSPSDKTSVDINGKTYEATADKSPKLLAPIGTGGDGESIAEHTSPGIPKADTGSLSKDGKPTGNIKLHPTGGYTTVDGKVYVDKRTADGKIGKNDFTGYAWNEESFRAHLINKKVKRVVVANSFKSGTQFVLANSSTGGKQIQGLNKNVTITNKDAVVNKALLKVVSNNVKISNLTLDGAAMNPKEKGNVGRLSAVIGATNVANLTVNNVSLKNSGIGVSLYGTTRNPTVTNSQFSNLRDAVLFNRDVETKSSKSPIGGKVDDFKNIGNVNISNNNISNVTTGIRLDAGNDGVWLKEALGIKPSQTNTPDRKLMTGVSTRVNGKIEGNTIRASKFGIGLANMDGSSADGKSKQMNINRNRVLVNGKKFSEAIHFENTTRNLKVTNNWAKVVGPSNGAAKSAYGINGFTDYGYDAKDQSNYTARNILFRNNFGERVKSSEDDGGFALLASLGFKNMTFEGNTFKTHGVFGDTTYTEGSDKFGNPKYENPYNVENYKKPGLRAKPIV